MISLILQFWPKNGSLVTLWHILHFLPSSICRCELHARALLYENNVHDFQTVFYAPFAHWFQKWRNSASFARGRHTIGCNAFTFKENLFKLKWQKMVSWSIASLGRWKFNSFLLPKTIGTFILLLFHEPLNAWYFWLRFLVEKIPNLHSKFIVFKIHKNVSFSIFYVNLGKNVNFGKMWILEKCEFWKNVKFWKLWILEINVN